MKCPYCGSEHEAGARFCTVTGQPIEAQQPKKKISPWLFVGLAGAALLCLVGVLVAAFVADGLRKQNDYSVSSRDDENEEKRPTRTANPIEEETPIPTGDIDLIYTQAAGTVAAELTKMASEYTPTPEPIEELGIGIFATKIREKDGMEMVYVPAGAFIMGSSDEQIDWIMDQDWFDSDKGRVWFDIEQPQHEVFLNAYWIDKTEVTNAQYTVCVSSGGCTIPDSEGSLTRDSYYNDEEYADYPVIYVDWSQAQAYCEWVGGSLPTEAQWEKAARGTDGRIFPWGNSQPTCNLANFDPLDGEECVGDTNAVGSYPNGASPYGALDMAGNLWEWVADWYDEDYYANSPSENPTGPASGEYHILRNSPWKFDGFSIRVTSRVFGNDNGNFITGFRCAIPVDNP